jgi:hypothetical protein
MFVHLLASPLAQLQTRVGRESAGGLENVAEMKAWPK